MNKLYQTYQKHIFLSIVILIMSTITGIANRAPVSDTLLFFLFQICCILIPGTALSYITRIKNIAVNENLMLGYSFGFTLNIILYFITQFLHIYKYIKFVYLAVFIISLLYIITRKNMIRNKKTTFLSNKTWLYILFLLFIISLFVFSVRYALPTFIESNWLFEDLLYWAGDAVELNRGFPPANFRTLQPGYFYHYFGALQIAVVSRVTGISIARTAFTYSFIQTLILMGLPAYCLTVRMIKNQSIRFLTLLLLFFTTGFEKQSLVTYYWHMYILPMGFNIAFGFGIITVLLLIIQIEKEEIDIANLVWMFLALIICTGSKAPTGVIALIGIITVCIYWLIKKEYKKALFHGVPIVSGFILIYLLILRGSAEKYLTSLASLSTLTVFDFIRYAVSLNPWTILPAFVYIYLCLKKGKLKLNDVVFAVMVVSGIILGYFISMYGISQMYFAMSIFSFSAILAGKAIDSLTDAVSSHYDRLTATWICQTGIIILLICIPAYAAELASIDVNDNVLKGLSHLTGRTDRLESTVQNAELLTDKEYEAYDWIRLNIDEDALLLCDYTLENYKFSLGVFTEKHVYCCDFVGDDQRLGEGAFSGDEGCIRHFAQKGVNYMVQTKEITPDFDYNETCCKKIYENEAIAVYEITP